MKYLIFFLVFVLLISCNTQNKYNKAENALDAGREFIDGCLKNDFKKAAFYILADTENNRSLRQLEQANNQLTTKDKTQYKLAAINIFEITDISETATIINYSNSYDKIRRKIKVAKVNGDWKVDLKATFGSN